MGRELGTFGLDEYQEVKQINIDLTDRPLGVYQHGKEAPETGKVVSLSERRPFSEEFGSDEWVGYCRNCRREGVAVVADVSERVAKGLRIAGPVGTGDPLTVRSPWDGAEVATIATTRLDEVDVVLALWQAPTSSKGASPRLGRAHFFSRPGDADPHPRSVLVFRGLSHVTTGQLTHGRPDSGPSGWSTNL